MRNKIRPIFLVFLAIFLVFINVTKVSAASEEYRQCSDSENCEIGEFLYNDDYTPITTATCTLNSKNPDGNAFLNDVSMTAQADGWYSYDVTTSGEDYGLYRSQICCTYLTEYICLDKSFEIATSSASLSDTQIADAVWDATRTDHNDADSFGENLQNPSSVTVDEIWSHPQRSLTSFGTLIADIWSYSSRSLNNVSSIVTGVWSNSERSITTTDLAGDSELATKSQVESAGSGTSNTDITANTTAIETLGNNLDGEISELAQQLTNNRYLLELLVNKPIIETFIEEGEEVPNLQAKIKETKKIAYTLSSDIKTLDKDIIALNTDWEDTNYQVALAEVSNASRVLGASTQTEIQPDNINSKIIWLNEKWKSPILSNLSVQTTSALSNIDGINREIRSYGKTFISQQYLNIAGQHVEKLDNIVGKENDSISDDTLFGYIAYLEKMSDTFIELSLDLDELINKWDNYTNSEKDIKLLRIKERFLAINQIDGAEILLKKKVNDEKHRENLALALKGLINSNLIFLAQDAGKISQNTWLEHGSIIFKSLVTNPSNIIAQNVEIKYYLPQEIGIEHIMKIEDGLETKFDAERNTLYVSGQFLLDPEETRSFIVEVTDIWKIPAEEIESIRKQTYTLFDSLKGTSYFAQGATMKADIEVNLDKIAILQTNNQTPELKIKSHREAMLELNSAKSKLEDLKTIVSSAGSIGTVFGFVGGVQAIAVWGLVIILIAGFVFLMIYLKMISRTPKDNLVESKNGKKANLSEANPSAGAKVEAKCDPPEKTSKITKKKETVHHTELSIFVLIKDIIVMKLNFNKKPKLKSKIKKKNIIIIFVLLVFVTSIVILTLIIVGNNSSKNELISPIPDSITSDFTTRHLTPKAIEQPKIELNTEVDNQPSKQVADANISNKTGTESENSGMVLGKTTGGTQDSQNTYETKQTGQEDNSLEKGQLVLATIPTGYQAINIRTQPQQNSQLSGRLYINQKVYVLQKKDGWALIKTNNQSLETPIAGWILEHLITEIP